MRHAEHEPRLPLRYLNKAPVVLNGIDRHHLRNAVGCAILQIGTPRKLHYAAPNPPRQSPNRKTHLAPPRCPASAVDLHSKSPLNIQDRPARKIVHFSSTILREKAAIRPVPSLA